MKVRIAVKDFDGVFAGLQRAALIEVGRRCFEGMRPDEAPLTESIVDEIVGNPVFRKWVNRAEKIIIEIDLDAGTAVVLPSTG